MTVTSTVHVVLFSLHFCIVGGRKNPEGVQEITVDGYTSSCSG